MGMCCRTASVTFQAFLLFPLQQLHPRARAESPTAPPQPHSCGYKIKVS